MLSAETKKKLKELFEDVAKEKEKSREKRI